MAVSAREGGGEAARFARRRSTDAGGGRGITYEEGANVSPVIVLPRSKMCFSSRRYGREESLKKFNIPTEKLVFEGISRPLKKKQRDGRQDLFFVSVDIYVRMLIARHFLGTRKKNTRKK